MQIRQITPASCELMNKSNSNFGTRNHTNYNVNFGSIPINEKKLGPMKKIYEKIMGPVEKKIANGLAWLMQTNPAKKLVKFTERTDFLKNNLYAHLLTLGSVIMSGFYVSRTLTNKKLDDKKKKTLAINQSAVFMASTIMAYTFDGIMNKKTDILKNKFRTLNLGKHIDNIEECIKGIDIAKKVMIFSTMNRFVAPVLVTPLAIYIGNKLQEKKEAELAFGNKK